MKFTKPFLFFRAFSIRHYPLFPNPQNDIQLIPSPFSQNPAFSLPCFDPFTAKYPSLTLHFHRFPPFPNYPLTLPPLAAPLSGNLQPHRSTDPPPRRTTSSRETHGTSPSHKELLHRVHERDVNNRFIHRSSPQAPAPLRYHCSNITAFHKLVAAFHAL